MQGPPPAVPPSAEAMDAALARAKHLASVRRSCDALRIIDSVDFASIRGGEGDPGNAQRFKTAMLLRALTLHELGRYDASLAAASQLLHVHPLSEEEVAQRDAIMMRCTYRLRLWRRCAEHAETLLVQENDDYAVEAFCTLGRVNSLAWKRPEAAGTFFQQALERDPTCSSAWDAIVDQWLVPPPRQLELLQSLHFPPHSEALRVTYAARTSQLARGEVSIVSDTPPDVSPAHLFQASLPELTASSGVPAYVVHYVRARRCYQANLLREALGHVSASLTEWPEHVDAIVLKLAVLVDLRATNDLFEFAHRVADELRPSPALAAYAVGCYHFSIAAFDEAGRYFCRATELDQQFAPGWLAYGNNYARLEEGEQALAAYRSAMSLFPGQTAIRTYIGVQHLRTGNGPLALAFLEEADSMMPSDPLTLNEMGVHAMRHDRDLQAALHFFSLARENLPNRDQPSEYHDCILFNLATVLRRLGHHDQALINFQHYVRVRPYAVAGHAALALTYHIMGNLRAAITHYHSALAIKQDAVCRDLLERALHEEMAMSSDHGFEPQRKEDAWMDAELSHHQSRPFARPSASPGAATPAFALSAVSRIARSESQAPPIGDASPAGGGSRRPTGPSGGISRALAF